MFFIGFNFFRGLLGIIMLPLAIWAAIWTYRDTANQGISHPWLWAGISFSIFPVGFLMYLIYRMYKKERV